MHLQQDEFNAHYNCGVAAFDAGNYHRAITHFTLAHAQQPDHRDTLFFLAASYTKIYHYQQAIRYYRRTIAVDPSSIAVLHNLAAAYYENGQITTAIEYYHQLLAQYPDNAPSRLCLSFAQLLLGKLSIGFQNYQARFQVTRHINTQRFPIDKLLISRITLTNKTVIVTTEQGFGDFIQCSRYSQLLKKQKASVILEVRPEMITLAKTLPFIDKVISSYETVIPHYDYYIPIMSLPLYFQTQLNTIPSAKQPYITPDKKKSIAFARIFSKTTQLRIGFVFAGLASHVDDHKRSMPFAKMQKILDNFSADFYCFQLNHHEPLLHDYIKKHRIHDLAPYIKDFSDSAALLSHLDLVIGIDSALIHLSAAMGIPTWVMISYVPDWRWLLNRDDSPWYPSIRLFRQSAINDWDPVIEKVLIALAQFAALPKK